ncbi:MAG: response regulator [Anaerolineae bacterium]|nr:response regulator [Anaerolineae bacterium]
MSDNPRDWTILLVEDQIPNLELVQMILQSRHMKVHTALNGVEGLKVLETVTPTAILLDLSMPVMDGWTMMEHMRRDARLSAIPVIALTAFSMDNDMGRVTRAGFAAYLMKPISPTTIVAEITKCLTTDTIKSD